MNRYLAFCALAALAASSGCQTFAPSGQANCGEPCHVTRSQFAPRPEIMRTAYHPGCQCCGGSGVGCCDTCGGNGCNTCGGSGVGPCAGCCMAMGGGPEWCGFCNRYCTCADDCGGYGYGGAPGAPGAYGGYGGGYGGHGQGMVTGAVATVLGDPAAKDNAYNFNPGPPTAQTAYPYYTARGPRDFLRNNPPPLGPY